MSDPRPDACYDAPVERIAGGRGQTRRAAAVAFTIAAAIGSAFVLAHIGVGAPQGIAAPVGSGRAAVPAPTASASGPAARPPNRARVEALVAAADRAMPGDPTVTFVERTATALRIRSWIAGQGLATIREVPLPPAVGASDTIFPVLAPIGDRLLLLSLGTDAGDTGDRARLLDGDGKLRWSGTGLTAASGALWSADGRLVVTSGRPRVWHLVTVDAAGTTAERLVHLPGDVFLPSPIPNGSISLPATEPRTVPLGFSADGAWIYGGVISPELGILIGQFRVSSDGRRVERIMDFGVGRPDGLVPRPGTLGTRTVDPATGRTATWRIGTDAVGGPRIVEVRNPDSGFAFALPGPATIAAEWGNDGGLYAVSANTLIYPDQVTLAKFGLDGTAGPPILETGPLTAAAFVGVSGRYAALALFVSRPTAAAELVLVSLDSKVVAAIPIPPGTDAQIIAAQVGP